MRKYFKLIYSISVFFICYVSCIGQTDTIGNRKQKNMYASFSFGSPLHNRLGYKNDVSQPNSYQSNSKNKIFYNFNLDFNFNHFTLNLFTNYLKNEFKGNSYLLRGYQLNDGSHNAPIYKYFEIYQIVKYNYLQIGTGIGYNVWRKKNNFAITSSFIYNLKTDIVVSSFFKTNSTFNNADTSMISLVKNHKVDRINKGFAFYGNIRFTYSRLLSKKMLFCFSINGTYGILNVYSNESDPYYDNGQLGYIIQFQKLIYPTIGIKYKIY
ncbi:MAG: hypothetical protein K9H41_04835 [Bacteroidia bacterium]|nr:hypothetical protein [Bacteroidia bacterium]